MRRSTNQLVSLVAVIGVVLSVVFVATGASAQGAGETIFGPTTCQQTTNDARAGIEPGMRQYTFGVGGATFVSGQNIIGTITFVDGGTADGGSPIAFSGGGYFYNVVASSSRAVASISVGPVLELNPGTAVEFVGPNCVESGVPEVVALADPSCPSIAANENVAEGVRAYGLALRNAEGVNVTAQIALSDGSTQVLSAISFTNGFGFGFDVPVGIELAGASAGPVSWTGEGSGIEFVVGSCEERPATPTPTPNSSTTSPRSATPACINSALVQGRADLQDKRVGFEFFDADNKARVITTGPSCKFFCQDGLDMNCDDQLFDTCPANLDANLVSGAKSCLQALSAPASVPTPAPTPTPLAESAESASVDVEAASTPAAPRPSFTG